MQVISGKCSDGFRLKDHVKEDTKIVKFVDFDTSEVKDMSYMFYQCNNVELIEGLDCFDTSKVENMSYMFKQYQGIFYDYEINKWDVSNVKNMDEMFEGICPSWYLDFTNPPEHYYQRIKFDLRDWKTPKLESARSMFESCSELKEIRLDNFGCSKNLRDISNMFYYADDLEFILQTILN